MKNRCNKCRLHKCRCKVVINKPVEVKVGGAGNDGLDAYEIAVLEGFIGTREEWIESLKGKDGSKIEERYAKNDDPDTPPAFIPTDRVPSGWHTQMPEDEEGTFTWVIKAYVSNEVPSVLESNWQAFRMTGLSGV